VVVEDEEDEVVENHNVAQINLYVRHRETFLYGEKKNK